jgi:predicted ester cyclase
MTRIEAHLDYIKSVVRSANEGVQRDGDFALFERLYAEDYVDHTPFGDFAPDRNGTRKIYETFRAAFTGWHAEIHQQVAEGDLVTTRKTYVGTHDGEFLGIAPTGRTIRFAVIDIMRVRDGRIADHWAVADAMGLFTQLSASPT